MPVERRGNGNPTVIHQSLRYSEKRCFARPKETIVIDPEARPFALGCVTIDWSGEYVSATFRYTRSCGGAPDRNWAHQTFHPAIDAWCQFVYNGRFSPDWDGDWWYEKTVVNIGLFTRLTPSVFMVDAPAHRYDASGRLF